MADRSKPAILCVDDDAGVLRAIGRDLRRRYGERFRVVAVASGQEGLEALAELALRGDQVALLVADQRMPQMDGITFLGRAVADWPDVKRVLVTAYSDSEAAIRAINDVGLDQYITKPWDPAEDLYPVVDDLLRDWEAAEAAGVGGLRVVGHRWSRGSHELKDFLARNLVPYRWLDVERSVEAARLLGATGADPDRLPVVVFEDGEALVAPELVQVADRIGMPTTAGDDFYDLVIVGAGPAGLAAAVYGASEGLRTILVEREAPGGQAGTSSRIENYLGFPQGLSGRELTQRATSQARRFGAEVVAVREAASIEPRGPARVVRLDGGGELAAHAVLVATGVSYRRLDVPGADELAGRGLYYGAARTEALACEGERVFVVGAGNSAGQAALFLARVAMQVTVLVRGASLATSMSRYLVDRIEEAPNVDVRTTTQIAALHGDRHLDAVTIRGAEGEERMPAASVFVFIGASPHTDWLGEHVARDERGFVLSGPDVAALDGRWKGDRDPYLLETSVPGVFVAGDVRHQSIKRVASAVGEGSMAVQFVHQYVGALE
jgi:thioredoxin reductase (NADPH)